MWVAGAQAAWWPATDLPNAVSQVVSCDDRPMGIAEQFRDARGHRCGLKLRWTPFTRAEFVERMDVLVGVALRRWPTVGRVVEEEEPAVRLESQTKGARRGSS